MPEDDNSLSQYDILAEQDSAFGDEGYFNNLDQGPIQGGMMGDYNYDNTPTVFNGGGIGGSDSVNQTLGGMFDTSGQNTNFGNLGGATSINSAMTAPQQQPQQSGIGGFLNQLFSNPAAGGIASAAAKLLAAGMEGQQNKQKSKAMQKLVQNNMGALDPFGSQRPYYQQQLQQAVQDPYSSPIVSAQVKQLQQAQAIRDAAAGRRSNSATSSPALLAAQAQVAQQYMSSLMQPAGAGLAPRSDLIMQYLSQGVNAGINGTTSPMASALNNIFRNDSADAQKAAAFDKMFGNQGSL